MISQGRRLLTAFLAAGLVVACSEAQPEIKNPPKAQDSRPLNATAFSSYLRDRIIIRNGLLISINSRGVDVVPWPATFSISCTTYSLMIGIGKADEPGASIRLLSDTTAILTTEQCLEYSEIVGRYLTERREPPSVDGHPSTPAGPASSR